MAYTAGGGTGYPSFDKSEDLMFQPGGSIQDYIRNMMLQGNVGMAQPMGNNIRDFAQDPMYGRDQPSDLGVTPYQRPLEEELPPVDGPYGEDPQEYIRQILAGDVVPMRTHPPAVSDVNMRLQSPGVGARSQGMQSIERFKGDPRSIDLLGILNMMGREPGR